MSVLFNYMCIILCIIQDVLGSCISFLYAVSKNPPTPCHKHRALEWNLGHIGGRNVCRQRDEQCVQCVHCREIAHTSECPLSEVPLYVKVESPHVDPRVIDLSGG